MLSPERMRYKDLSNWLPGHVYSPQGDEIEMLAVCGMFNSHTNRHGLVRDHIFPRYGGFKFRVFPELLRHPANCRFIPQQENFDKRPQDYEVGLSSIEDLFKRIENWRGQWKEHNLCLQLIRRYRAGDCYDPDTRRRSPRKPIPAPLAQSSGKPVRDLGWPPPKPDPFKPDPLAYPADLSERISAIWNIRGAGPAPRTFAQMDEFYTRTVEELSQQRKEKAKEGNIRGAAKRKARRVQRKQEPYTGLFPGLGDIINSLDNPLDDTGYKGLFPDPTDK